MSSITAAAPHATITTRTLTSGLTLITEPMAGVRSASITLLVPCGIMHEREDRLGTCAMIEELLQRGAGDLDSRAQADAFDRCGFSRGSDAGSAVTRFSATGLGDRLDDALALLFDMALRPRFSEDAIEPARELALQSLESLKDDPQERAMIATRERHLPSPLNRSGLGTVEGLTAITRDELIEAWSRLARPKPSVIALAGAIGDVDKLAARVESLTHHWRGATLEPAIASAPPRGYAHADDASAQVQIVLAHDAPKESHPDCLLEKLVISVLSGGMAGRLFTEVREKRGLCYSVHAGYRADRDYGITSAYVGTTPERAQQSLDVLVEQLRKLETPEGAITSAEFARAKIGMKSSLVFSGESTAARAASIASDWRRIGRPRSLEELIRAIDEASLDSVNAYLTRRRMGTVTIQTLGPKPLISPLG
jgi:predicted Zn-dependent peptidase